MTIDAYEPELTVEELRERLDGLEDDLPLVAAMRGPYINPGDVRWLCEEVLRLRQDLARPRASQNAQND